MCINGGYIIDIEHPGADDFLLGNAAGSIRQFAAHQHLYFEGDPLTHVFVIESGWVKLYRTLIDGQRQVVGFCNGGSILGLEAGEGHVNACEAITAVKVRAIPVGRIPDLCSRNPKLASQLLRQMGRQLGAAQAQLTTVGAQSADQKLATFLLAFADFDLGQGDEFDLPMRRSDIAEFLGLRLETVSRTLTDFQRRKWVRMVSLYRCHVLDRAALESLAEGGEADIRAAG